MTEMERLSAAYESLKVRHWELKSGINNKGWRLQIAVLEDRLQKRGEIILQYANEIKELKGKISELNMQLKTAQQWIKDHQPENMVIPDIDPGSPGMGAWVPQSKYLALMEKYKQLKAEKV